MSNSIATVYPIQCLSDNYAYLVYDRKKKIGFLVDPVEPKNIYKKLNELDISKDAILKVLTTHKHSDHAAGNETIKKDIPICEIVGGELDNCSAVTKSVRDNMILNIGDFTVTCLHTPCHTRGHICYYVEHQDKEFVPCVFSGDTLFIGGCGRTFEGSHEDMWKNLQRLSKLPDNTRIFSGHEYTQSNLRFASKMCPDNMVRQQCVYIIFV